MILRYNPLGFFFCLLINLHDLSLKWLVCLAILVVFLMKSLTQKSIVVFFTNKKTFVVVDRYVGVDANVFKGIIACHGHFNETKSAFILSNNIIKQNIK